MSKKKVIKNLQDGDGTITAGPETAVAVPKVESRRFKMHPKLLHDVILRQAGTLSKAAT
jgi:hypothetical protein